MLLHNPLSQSLHLFGKGLEAFWGALANFVHIQPEGFEFFVQDVGYVRGRDLFINRGQHLFKHLGRGCPAVFLAHVLQVDVRQFGGYAFPPGNGQGQVNFSAF